MAASSNMYRVGDYVYFESSSSAPYLIRRIEELSKNASSGQVECRVQCFYRRRDIPSTLNILADRHQSAFAPNSDTEEDQTSTKEAEEAATKAEDVEKSEPSTETAAAGGDEKEEEKPTPMEADAAAAPAESMTAEDGTTASTSEKPPSVSTQQREKIEKVRMFVEENLSADQKHKLKHRELFLSRQVEQLPATHIRGKCSVALLNETESLASYIEKDDCFFYSLVYDPQQKTLLADRGEIRVGGKYQADPTSLLAEGEGDGRNLEEMETLVWDPQNALSDREVDQFLVIARSVGTFARALDCSSSVKQPSLHMSAAAASRDVTLFHAMNTLHESGYSLSQALSAMVPSTGPILCRDQMEDWSVSEANLFEEALEKYGKDFMEIRQDFLPWKPLKHIIEYFYMWKTTDRYVQQKRVKAVEAESKLKQVYIPTYNKPNPAVLDTSPALNLANGSSAPYNLSTTAPSRPLVNGDGGGGIKCCESCSTTTSAQWYIWTSGTRRLCSNCWNYWKKYGGLVAQSASVFEEEAEQIAEGGDFACRECDKSYSRQDRLVAHLQTHRVYSCPVAACGKDFRLKAHLIRHCAMLHSLDLRAGSPRPIMKTRNAFFMKAPIAAKVVRKVCPKLLRLRHLSRSPFTSIDMQALKNEVTEQYQNKTEADMQILIKTTPVQRPNLLRITLGLGQTVKEVPKLLEKTDPSLLPKFDRLAFPALPKRKDGSYIYDPIPNKPQIAPLLPTVGMGSMHSSLLKRKHPVEDLSVAGADVSKRPAMTISTGSPSSAATAAQALPPSFVRGSIEIFPSPASASSSAATSKVTLKPAAAVATLASLHHHVSQRASTSVYRPRQVVSLDAPDDVFYKSLPVHRKLRKQLTPADIKRAARRPWRRIKIGGIPY
ncbi:unnamed protein product [Cyprideis torosa]|uniref:Uncharacterized protein n=1 Tax=Cyprideis torosa TaxID=163714 RepID=A0A7R8W0F1_9CRUS|nr:unnamed protein product [Cyprideis torosa]CAG0879492.1 unnamed protein product [Cyprideis torosa]